jgi:peptidyl-tRNA hydrolase, PTH1 family
MTWLITGLGNPGSRYEFTRHNFGFLFVDQLRYKWNFPKWKYQKKFKAEISKEKITSEIELILCKPQTFMNLSGESIRPLYDFYNLSIQNILVCYDDLDLPLGRVKLKQKGSAGGHKGMQSIIGMLGTSDIARLKFGINKPPHGMPAEQFVLFRFLEEEINIVKQVIDSSVEHIKLLLEGKNELAQNAINNLNFQPIQNDELDNK